ncbi:MAG: hypothetical protein HN868_06630 [Gammaproteobacteria bacterium]|nr:hypothetical protein [Gammaproteobacteria bacterium]
MVTENTKQTLDQLLPYGMIATKQWLLSMGLSLHSIDNALKSKKLNMQATGVYARTGVPITWQGVVCSLQKMSDQTIDVGGLTALELLGYGQYLSNNKSKIIRLYSMNKLPAWLNKLKLPVTFEWHGTKTLWAPGVVENASYTIEHSWRDDLRPVKLSCPEKAMLEVLTDLPDIISFEHADELMQGMTSLSPKKLTVLLHACSNVKVKRLFFWIADRADYSWVNKLDYREFNLGKGKRVIATKGKLDNKYLITVPKDLYG